MPNLHCPGLAVPTEQETRLPGQLFCCDDAAIRQLNLGSGRYIKPGVDDTFIAK